MSILQRSTLLLLALAAAATGAAQTPLRTALAPAPSAPVSALPSTGAIAGVVVGPDGAHLPGVTVAAVDAAGLAVSTVVSSDHGGYVITAVPAGAYVLRAELSGFVQPGPLPIEVAEGRTTTAHVRLALDAVREEVRVFGSAPRDSLEAPRVAESSARDVGEVLASMPGLWKVRRGGIANDVVLRGYQGENVNVTIDGVRLYGACPNNMDHTAFHVDFAEVDRIEVGKGPFEITSQGALGGTVNIVTRRPSPGFHATTRLTTGSFGFVNPSVTVSAGGPRLTVLGGYSYRASDVYTDGSGQKFTAGANYKPSVADRRAFEVHTGWARIDLAPASGHAATMAYTRQDAGLVLYPYLQMDALSDTADRVNTTYQLSRRIGPIEAVRAQAYFTQVDHWMTDEHRVSSQGMARAYSMGTRATTESRGAKAEATFGSGTAGVEWYRRGWNTETELAMAKYARQYSIPDVTLTSIGAFAEYSIRPTGALTIDVGGRLDSTRNEADPAKAGTPLYLAYQDVAATSARDTYPSGKARVSYRLDGGLTLSGGIGRTVRVPDPQERYFALRRMGTDWVGNPALRPTTNTGLDVQASFRRSRLYLNVSLYRDALGDYVTVYRQARQNAVAGVMNTTARSFRNVDATMTGGEMEAVVSLTGRVFLGADLSAVRGRQALDPGHGITSESLAEIPPARGRLSLRYDTRRTRSGFFVEAEGIFAARQDRVDTDVLESPTASYAIANLRAGANVGWLRVVAGVGNVFDVRYLEHLSYQRDPFRSGAKVFEPGRNLYVNLAVGF